MTTLCNWWQIRILDSSVMRTDLREPRGAGAKSNAHFSYLVLPSTDSITNNVDLWTQSSFKSQPHVLERESVV